MFITLQPGEFFYINAPAGKRLCRILESVQVQNPPRQQIRATYLPAEATFMIPLPPIGELGPISPAS
jgi:hypothetical protein